MDISTPMDDLGGRTASSPISRLPSELLESIFIHRARDHHSNEFTLPRRYVPSWINVSYVCRYWRNVALGCPTLWTYHFVVSLRWTEELLARSNRVPLKVRLWFHEGNHSSWWLDPVQKLMDNTNCFEELCLHLPDFSSRQILSMLSSRALLLQKLVLVTPACGVPFGQSFLLFHGETPVLRTLELSGCPVPWYSFKLGSLTSLKLSCLPAWVQQDTAEFLATLSGMQRLKALYLHDSLASAVSFLSSAAFRTLQKLNIPHLTSVSINAPLSTVIVFLSCVYFPLNARVELVCHPEDVSSIHDFTLLSSALAQRFCIPKDQELSSLTIQSLSIDSSGVRRVTLLFSTSEGYCDTFDFEMGQGRLPSRDPSLALTVHWDESMIRIEDQIIWNTCCSIPLTNVQSIHFTNPPLASGFWRNILGHLPSLRCIKLSRGRMPDLASALSVTNLPTHEDIVNQVNDQNRDDILAPHLEELFLSRIDFSPEGDSGLLNTAITERALFDALLTRCMPQCRVTMTRCTTIGSGRFDALRSWDGLINIRTVSETISDEDSSEDDSWEYSDGSWDYSGDDIEDEVEDDSESDLVDGADGTSDSEGHLGDEPEDDSEDDLEDESGGNWGGELEEGSEGNSGDDPEYEAEEDSGGDLEDEPVEENSEVDDEPEEDLELQDEPDDDSGGYPENDWEES